VANREEVAGEPMSPALKASPTNTTERNTLQRIESYFEFGKLGTNWRTEILAGLTTFTTMATCASSIATIMLPATANRCGCRAPSF